MKSCCLLPLQDAVRLYGGVHGCTAATLPGYPGPLPLYAKSYAKTRKNRQKAQINTKIKLYILDSHVIINNTLY